jgi:hypothetical protein
MRLFKKLCCIEGAQAQHSFAAHPVASLMSVSQDNENNPLFSFSDSLSFTPMHNNREVYSLKARPICSSYKDNGQRFLTLGLKISGDLTF